MMRPAMNGPRSFTRTLTDFPLERFVTLTKQGNGKVLCAAIRCHGMTFSPSDVLPRTNPKNFDSLYQEAVPTSL